MLVSGEIAGFVVSAAKAIIGMAHRADLLLAERSAVQSALVMPLPTDGAVPASATARRELGELLGSTEGQSPDPLGDDRKAITKLLASADPDYAVVVQYYMRHLPDRVAERAWNPNAAVLAGLGALNPAWGPSPDSDYSRALKLAVFGLSASRLKPGAISYEWRLALLVADVVMEYGADNSGKLIRNPRTEAVLKSVLVRLSAPDLGSFDRWTTLLEHALRGALDGLLDARTALASDSALLDDVLGALSAARERVDDPDEFLLGLVRGRGWPVLVGVSLELGAVKLRAGDHDALEELLADLLEASAPLAGKSSDFNAFFRDHWGDLVTTGLKSLDRLGPALLDGESPLLKAALLGAIKAAANMEVTSLQSPRVFIALVDAAIDGIAADPDLIDEAVREKWLGGLLKTVLGVVTDKGIVGSISPEGIERVTLAAIGSLANAPELLAKQDTFARVLQAVLQEVSAMPSLRGDTAESLASAILRGTLEGIADDPRLADRKLGPLLSDVVGGIGELLATRRLRDVHVEDLAAKVLEAIKANSELFVEIERDLAGVTLRAVAKAANGDEAKLLTGTALVSVAGEVLISLAAHGRLLAETVDAAEIGERIAATLASGLSRAGNELGRRMSRADLPEVLGRLIGALARGELATTDPEDPNFKRIFSSIADAVAA